MNIRLSSAIIASKLIIRVLRLMRSGGTSLPGRIARKLCPDILKTITKDFYVIMVTGTNGKTTTSRIISQILNENKISHIENKSGANLVYGILTTFIEAVDIHGKCPVKTALIEVDEAAFGIITNQLQPDILVVTNFFRDQLDRYGELYTTLKRVKAGIENSPKTKLVLNADDSLCASLGRDTVNEAIYYGFDTDAYKSSTLLVNSDATFCLYCKSKYQYTNRVYGHLGGFECPNCGYSKPATQVTCIGVDNLTSSFSEIRVVAEDNSRLADQGNIETGVTRNDNTTDCAEEIAQDNSNEYYPARVNLPGLYNVYNALAALTCGYLMNLPIDNSIKALGSFECGFGRMETISTNGKYIKLILVKNPTGFNQVLNYLLTEDKNIQLAFIINDKAADGTDISWLWDVEFEVLQNIQELIDDIYTSGIRAEDMAVRLKYAGMYTNKINITKDYEVLINTGLSKTADGHSFYILPTYTAMLDIRRTLKKKFGLKDFWK